MLLQLGGRSLRSLSPVSNTPLLGRICEDPDVPLSERKREILLLRAPTSDIPEGFLAYLMQAAVAPPCHARDVYHLAPEMHYLVHGDIVRISPLQQAIRVLYRRNSSSNSFLLTERCDNYCIMCSQPPKPADDTWLLDELIEVVDLISTETRELGITGGEPTLLGDRFLALIKLLRDLLPSTAIHVLTNGRRFSDPTFARNLSAIGHPDLMLGIPLYSDLASEHDYVVQARGAYSQTVRGIVNLKRWGAAVEVRFVIHAETWRRLPEFARFLSRNLLFVDHVALMGLELTGFAKTNLEALWVDPLEYQRELTQATTTLERAGINVSIYNHPLCVLAPQVHHVARRSISDWKNMYLPECNRCVRQSECGGFFASSALRRSEGIRPFTADEYQTGSSAHR